MLDLLLPGNGNELLPIGTTGWPHYPYLKTGIFSWMKECERPSYHTRQTRIFGPGVILAQVTVQLIVDDYWLLQTQHGGVNEQGRIEVVTGPPMARPSCASGEAGTTCLTMAAEWLSSNSL